MSKELDALYNLIARLEPSKDNIAKAEVDIKTLKNALKALEIIKEKEVNVFDVLATGYVEYYNMCVVNKIRPEYCDSYFLTKEEFILLKEVLL